MKLQYSLRECRKYVNWLYGSSMAISTTLLPCHLLNLLMCNWTDCKCSPQGVEPRPSGKPSAPVSPHCSTYVAIDQAPVSACHICAQTSVALICLTVTDDHASGGWCRWWMNGLALCVTFSLSLFPVFRWAVQGVIIKPQHLYSLSSGLRTLCSD